MRKSILFVAKFDNILKSMNTILAKSFNMQMCPPEPAMIEKTLDVMEFDLILLYISGLPEKLLRSLCDKLGHESMQAPVVVFGTAEECAEFDQYSTIAISKYMHRPLAVQDMTKAIFELFEAEPEQPQADPPQTLHTPDSAEIQQNLERKKSMSLADLADSLEADPRRCILLVDDDGRILRAIKMLLEEHYRINLANSGMSALAAIERERPDAVLLDYEMPMLDGKQTLKMIRQNKKTQDLPVFFLTGVADRDRIRDVIHLKPQGYILKSSEQNVILETLEKFFNSQSI